MLHDVLVVLGVEAILAYFLGWEADALFLTALLTVIGFSVHDTIVVFDRIRENSHVYRRVAYEPLVNHSIVQTLDRSLNTQLTVMFTLFALVLFGGESIRHFVHHLARGYFQWDVFFDFQRLPHSGCVGKPGMEELVPPPGYRLVTYLICEIKTPLFRGVFSFDPESHFR